MTDDLIDWRTVEHPLDIALQLVALALRTLLALTIMSLGIIGIIAAARTVAQIIGT